VVTVVHSRPNDTDAAIVVVHHSRTGILRQCLRSAHEQGFPTVVVDVSPDGEAEHVARVENVARYVAAPENRGYGWACNLGVAATEAAVVVVSNNDVVFGKGALAALVDSARGARVVAAPLQVAPDGRPTLDNVLPRPCLREATARWVGVGRRKQAAARRTVIESAERSGVPCDLSDDFLLSGACLALDRATYREIDGFDTRFFLYEEDIDLCLRARIAGARLLLVPRAVVEHTSGTNGRELDVQVLSIARTSQLRLWAKHGLPVPVLVVLQTLGVLLRGVRAAAGADARAAGMWFRAISSSSRRSAT
jgi:N-acetylglucosaminyl-diphospho-decaprenol L-rhamnosyltransferase